MDKQVETLDFTDIDFSEEDILNKHSYNRRRCPIIVTLAGAQITTVDIQKMLEADVNGIKFKMSYSTTGDKIRLLGKIDKAAAECCEKNGVSEWPIATCIELKTCIAKTGMLETDNSYIILNEGKEVILTWNILEYNKCNEHKIFVDNRYMTTDVKVGTIISIDADEIVLKCTRVLDVKQIQCIVIKSGKLGNVCNVCARAIKHSRPYLSKNDLEIVKFALEYQIDMIIVNYPRHMKTLQKLKQYMGKKLKRPLLLSGICTQECMDNFDEIIKESDGIILSREYLPYELDERSQYRLPRIQKWMAAKCIESGKPFYISGVFQNALATGIFDDTEVSDVTNAILEGASGFILKDCFDIEYLLEVLAALKQICNSVEPLATSKVGFYRTIEEPKVPLNAAEAAVISCATVANLTNATLVIIPTVSGKTIQLLHQAKLSCIIIAISSNTGVIRKLQTYRGIYPLMYIGTQLKEWQKTVEAKVSFAIEFAVKRSWITYGDPYVSLYRASESSSFCDAVGIWKVIVAKKSLVECTTETDIEEL